MRFRLPAVFAPILLITLLTLLLTACHTAKALLPTKLLPAPDAGHSLETAKQQLKDATPCCGSFADFSYDTMLPWQPKKFQLGSGSLVADLNGVRSYFLAFRLPVGVKLPYRVALKSELNGRWLQSSYLFAPSTVLLDEAFQPIDSQDVNLCEYMGWSDEASGAFGSVTISSDKARYLVVYASDKQQTSATYWEQSPAAFSAEAPVKMNSNGSFKIPHGPDGTIWIGIIDKTYAKAVDNAICSKPPQGDGVLNTLRTALPTHWNWSHS